MIDVLVCEALAFLHGEPQLTALVTAAGFPCGHCRQFLSEIAGIDRAVFLAASDETVSNTTWYDWGGVPIFSSP